MAIFCVGQPVLAAQSGIGVVIEVNEGAPEPSYRVFLDGRPQHFFESQLSSANLGTTHEAATAETLRCRLTALRLVSPSAGEAMSLNEGRIDHIPYQYRPLLRLLRADRPRLLVADEVGVGKTIETGLILRELHARRELRRVLVVCSKALVVEEKWHREMRRFDEEFVSLDGATLRHCIKQTDMDGEWPERFSRAILPFSLFTEELLLGEGSGIRKRKGLLELSPPPAFDLVIVDEAHNARNPDSWLHRGLRVLCGNAEAVLLLTATPIQLGSHELFHLLNLLRPDTVIDQSTFERMAEPNPYINAAVAVARKGAEGWALEAGNELIQAACTPWGSAMLASDPRFRSVQSRLCGQPTDADRVKLIRDMEELHTFSHMINRTRRRDIGEFTLRQARTEAIPFTLEQQKLHDETLKVQERLLLLRHGAAPVAFLMSTIRRQLASCIHGLAPLLEDVMQRGIDALESQDGELGDWELEALEPIRGDIDALLELARHLSPQDPKLDRLVWIAREKLAMPNHRLLVFSTFRHTLAYIEQGLIAAGVRVATVHGGIADEDRRSVRRRFALPKENPEAIDVMLSSEVGSEGLDFQFCDAIANYDIPWNPMRVEQRIGRIDRYGQKSETVAIWNFVTPGTVDFDVYDRCLLRIGVFSRSIGGCEDILGEIAREIRSVAEDIALGPEERQVRLQQLADNDIRLLQEQEELESRQAELFGVRPAAGNGRDVGAADAVWLAPTALERLVRAYLDRLFPGRESLLGSDVVKTLRLAGEARRDLLAKTSVKGTRPSLTDREWTAWLKGGEPILHVTFERSAARDEPQIKLVTAVHPLVKHAAKELSSDQPLDVYLQVRSAQVPSGRYPFALYLWRFTGIRADAKIVPVTAYSGTSEEFLALLDHAEDLPAGEGAGGDFDALEALHHRLWSTARAAHRDETLAIAAFRRESFLASHQARMATLRELQAAATDAKIKRMRAAQASAAQAEADRRLAEFAEAEAAADVLIGLVARGTLLVEGI